MSWCPRQTVLVPVDFSDPSVEAMRIASEMVASTEHLHVAHVLSLPYASHPSLDWDQIDLQERKRSIQTLLTELCREEGINGAQAHTIQGDPGRAIVSLASSIGADLIVIPTHGRTGLKRLVIGSVTERVVRYAPCPVLVLRATTGKKDAGKA